MRSGSATGRDSLSGSTTSRNSRTENIDVTPTGAHDDTGLPVTDDTIGVAKLAVTTDETDAGTSSCLSSPGRLASEGSAAALPLPVCVMADSRSL